MSFLSDDFPGYAPSYNADLGWLIKEYKRLIEEYNTLQAQYTELAALKDTLLDAITSIDSKVSDAVNTALVDIDTKFAELTSQMDAYKTELKQYIDNQLYDFKTDIDNQFKPMTDNINNVLNRMTEVEADMIAFKANVQVQLSGLSDKLDTLEDSLKADLTEYIDAQIDAWSAQLPLVRNPVTGTQTSVESAMSDLFNDYKDRDTATLADAEVYADTIVSALHTLVSDEIADVRQSVITNTILRNPVTGMLSNGINLVLWICEQLKDAYTAEEFDKLQINATELDRYNVTAFAFDWTKWPIIMRIPPTVAEITNANLSVSTITNASINVYIMTTTRAWFDNLLEDKKRGWIYG